MSRLVTRAFATPWARLLLGLVLAFSVGTVSARDDHEQARAALESGQIQPLRSILESLERSHPGRVMEVELEQKRGAWWYEIKLLQPDGRLVKLWVDARSGQVVQRTK